MSKPKLQNSILKVLKDERRALHYTEVAELLVQKNLHALSDNLPYSVNQYLHKMEDVTKVDRGVFIYKDYYADYLVNNPIEDESTALIGAYGRYWDPNILEKKKHLQGFHRNKKIAVNFDMEIGVYLLHKGDRVVYVGKTAKQTLYDRITQHLSCNDPVYGHWDSFSWFGILGINSENNQVKKSAQKVNLTNDKLITSLEALLIELFEPGLNRKYGDELRIKEYFQNN